MLGWAHPGSRSSPPSPMVFHGVGPHPVNPHPGKVGTIGPRGGLLVEGRGNARSGGRSVETQRDGAGVRFLGTLFHAGTAAGRTDGQLLEWFATGSPEAAELAFATLVERHGVMVLRTCRAVLRDEHAAQDAFQATFLILVRHGATLWVQDSLAPWLHRVARRVAVRARRDALRRMSAEQAVTSSRTRTEQASGD